MTGDIESRALSITPKIQVVEIISPMRLEHRVESWIAWSPSKPLAEYIPEGGEFVASISGKIIPAWEWDTTFPLPDDCIVICPVLQGGSTGKTILRVVAFIALAVLAVYTGGLVAGAYGAAWGAAAEAGIMIAGSMLINALLPIQPASLGKTNSDMSESPSYGIDGAINTSDEGIGVPVCYGKFRMAGNIIGFYAENAGKTQILYMLFNAGEGPVAGISDIEINGQPLSAYQDVVVMTRTGTQDQDMIPWFADTLDLKDAGNALISHITIPDDAAPFRVTTQEVDRLRVDVVAPQGLFSVNQDDGSLRSTSVPLTIAYAPCDAAGNTTGDWKTDFGTVSVATYVNEYHYLPFPIYDPDTGQLIGGSETETVQSTLNSGDVVCTDGTIIEWELGQIEHLGECRSHNGVNYICTGGHTADAHYEPGIGDQWTHGWIAMGTITVNVDDIVSSAGNRVGYVTQTANYDPGTTGDTVMGGQSRFPVRQSFYSPALTPGYYKVQIARNTDQGTDATKIQDELHWETLGEIILDDINYVNTALVALKIRLSDQLSQVPNVTYVNQGVMTKQYDPTLNSGAGGWTAASSGNPAWVALDMITNTRYGARVPWSAVDIAAFSDWAAYCDAQSPPLKFNGVLDQQMAFWDAMKYVGRCGHGTITRVGTRFSVVIEREEDPVMMFSEANIIKGSFNINYLALEDRANTIDVTYWDEADEYQQKTVKIIDPTLSDLALERNAAVQLIGVTNRDRALAEGWLQLNLNNWVSRTIEFQAGLDSIACVPGSVITVKHVAAEVAVSGRFAADAGGDNHIKLDSEITFNSGSTYTGIAVAPTATCFATPITNVDLARNAIAVDNVTGGTFPPSAVGIMQTGGVAYSVSSFFQDPATPTRSWFVIEPTQSVLGVTIGQSVSGIAIDGMMTGAVTPAGGLYDTPVTEIVWAGASDSSNPLKQGWHYVIGPDTETRRRYRVTNIDPGNDPYTRTIKAIEYHPEVYSALGYLPPPPPGGGGEGNGVIGQVLNLALDTNEVGAGPNPRYQMEAHWDPPAFGTYAGALVFRRIDGSNEWQQVTEVKDGGLSYTFDAAYGEHILLKVQAKDNAGVSPPFSSAPTVELTVGEDTTVGVLPTALFVNRGFQALYVSWFVDKPEKLKSTKVYYTFDGGGTNPSSNPADATLAIEAVGLSYTFPAQAGTYRFWIKTVDKFERESDFYPLPNGVTGSAIILVSDLMDILDDEIYASLLDQFLRERIEIIPDLIDIDTFVQSLNGLLGLGLVGNGNGAAVQTLQSAVTDAQAATAQSITQLQSRMDNSEAVIQQEMQTRATEDTAEAFMRTQLAAQITDIDGQLNGADGVFDLIAGIDQSLDVIVHGQQAEATARQTLATQLTGNNFDTGNQTIETDSVIGSMQQAISTLNGPDGMVGSIAYSISQLRTDLVYNIDNPLSAISLQAGITHVDEAVTGLTGPDGAITLLAEHVDQLWVGGSTPGGEIGRALEQRMLVSDAEAAYWLKIEVDNPGEPPIVAGFGLGWEADTDRFTFIVRTNQFAVGDTAGTADFPFIVNDGTDGNPRGVYMRNAFIQDAAVDTLKIAGNAVSVVATGSTAVTVEVAPGATVQLIGAATCHGHNDRLAGRMDLYIDVGGVQGVGHGVAVLWFNNHDSRDFDISATAAGAWTNTSSSARTVTCNLRIVGSDGDGNLQLNITNASIYASVLKR